MALQANFLTVELAAPAPEMCLLCTRRTRLLHRGADVHVGDQVWVESIDWMNSRAVVCDVSPRKSWLERPPVANVTSVVVALSMLEPSLDTDQASRFLLTAEQTGLDVQLVLTKTDLIGEVELKEHSRLFSSWGYQPLAVSANTGKGMEQLKRKLEKSSLSVLCGPSGVGKSSLLNRILPEISLRVGEVSSRLQRGRHTTRHVELFQLPGGARVADTPGFNRPDLPKDPRLLAALFPEIRRQLHPYPCRFRNCLHLNEPDCGIDQDWYRYSIYCQNVKELLNLNCPFREG